jgi:hypothetical protein
MIDIELDRFKELTWQWATEINGKNDEAERLATEKYLNLPDWHEYSLTRISERKFLSWIAKKLPKNSQVIEIGTYLGVSAAIMAYSNPDINIKSIDSYDWADNNFFFQIINNEKTKQFLNENAPYNIGHIKNRWNKFKNLEFIKARSPYDFADTQWPEIDLYFEDGSHINPHIMNNVTYWSKWVKKGGLIIIHDYRPYLDESYNHIKRNKPPLRWPDVESAVNNLIDQGYIKLGTVSSLIILRKPN